MTHFNVSFATDVGMKRRQNQDSGAALPEIGLFMVADGMGGHRGGETASSMAVAVITESVRCALQQGGSTPAKVLTEAIGAASKAIHERAAKQPELSGMGTTTTAILFSGDTLTIGHVGDSRCYFIRPGKIWQVTRDHSLVQEKFRAGLITRDQIKTDKLKNVITRSVGFEPSVEVEIFEMDALPGDAFMLCSDGLSGLADEKSILEVIEKRLYGENDIKSAATDLIKTANDRGGDDNITAIIIVKDPPEQNG
ncbi:MAG: hypothetical protein A2583_08895 [Bdellovibrionales bacterium RIFOXYD1_FULL_53_11]|nr:MAG: hypothetical protein A2583_08895 [Bdellovibrionales bacterium RIFOXYD1_FULL_53_11]